MKMRRSSFLTGLRWVTFLCHLSKSPLVMVGNLLEFSQDKRGWKIWRAYLSACYFLTDAIIYQAGRAYKKEEKK
jgi:hypothetical protein